MIIGIYASINNASDQEKTAFYNQVIILLDENENRKELFIMGDLTTKREETKWERG